MKDGWGSRPPPLPEPPLSATGWSYKWVRWHVFFYVILAVSWRVAGCTKMLCTLIWAHPGLEKRSRSRKKARFWMCGIARYQNWHPKSFIWSPVCLEKVFPINKLPPLPPISPALDDSMIGSDVFRGSAVTALQDREVQPAAPVGSFARFQGSFLAS